MSQLNPDGDRANVPRRLSPLRRIHPMRLASWLLILCGCILGFDIGSELHGFLLSGPAYGALAMVHLTGEVLATLGTGWAFMLTRAELRRSARSHQADRDRLKALRSDFDRLMWQHFHQWVLSPAECDVALLTVRGLTISQIAKLRNTQEGTVKSQLSTIYRKSGFSTRSELLAHFMDEFLDHAGSEGVEDAAMDAAARIEAGGTGSGTGAGGVGPKDPVRRP